MKKIIIGVIIGFILSTLSVSMAENQGVFVEFASFKFIINGENKEIKNKPLVYNGTSYLPVREISNLLGYNVEYDANTRTIILNNTMNNKETNTNDTNDQWISLLEINKRYNIQRTIDKEETTLTNGKISISFKNVNGDGIFLITTKYGDFHYKIEKGRSYFILNELKNLGLIP